MKYLLPLIILLFSVFSFGQTARVTATKANLRGTPDANGIVIATVKQSEVFPVLVIEYEWVLVQTPKYVGWLSFSVASVEVQVNKGEELKIAKQEPMTIAKPPEYAPIKPLIVGEPQKPRPVPPGTAVPSNETSPFQSEYVGENYPTTIELENQTVKTLTLEFGGVKYAVSPNGKQTIVIDPGSYAYTASAIGVNSKSGIHLFEKGRRYSWTFFIQKH